MSDYQPETPRSYASSVPARTATYSEVTGTLNRQASPDSVISATSSVQDYQPDTPRSHASSVPARTATYSEVMGTLNRQASPDGVVSSTSSVQENGLLSSLSERSEYVDRAPTTLSLDSHENPPSQGSGPGRPTYGRSFDPMSISDAKENKIAKKKSNILENSPSVFSRRRAIHSFGFSISENDKKWFGIQTPCRTVWTKDSMEKYRDTACYLWTIGVIGVVLWILSGFIFDIDVVSDCTFNVAMGNRTTSGDVVGVFVSGGLQDCEDGCCQEEKCSVLSYDVLTRICTMFQAVSSYTPDLNHVTAIRGHVHTLDPVEESGLHFQIIYLIIVLTYVFFLWLFEFTQIDKTLAILLLKRFEFWFLHISLWMNASTTWERFSRLGIYGIYNIGAFALYVCVGTWVLLWDANPHFSGRKRRRFKIFLLTLIILMASMVHVKRAILQKDVTQEICFLSTGFCTTVAVGLSNPARVNLIVFIFKYWVSVTFFPDRMMILKASVALLPNTGTTVDVDNTYE